MIKTEIAVAVYDSHAQVEEAMQALVKSGFEMKAISILGNIYHSKEHLICYFDAGERAMFFGRHGAFWSGMARMLFGPALLFASATDPIVVLGPLAATIVGERQIGVLGSGFAALVGALTAIGAPRDSMLRYEMALKTNKFLVIVHGGSQNDEIARDILLEAGSKDVRMHAGNM